MILTQEGFEKVTKLAKSLASDAAAQQTMDSTESSETEPEFINEAIKQKIQNIKTVAKNSFTDEEWEVINKTPGIENIEPGFILLARKLGTAITTATAVGAGALAYSLGQALTSNLNALNSAKIGIGSVIYLSNKIVSVSEAILGAASIIKQAKISEAVSEAEGTSQVSLATFKAVANKAFQVITHAALRGAISGALTKSLQISGAALLTQLSNKYHVSENKIKFASSILEIGNFVTTHIITTRLVDRFKNP